MKENMSPAVDGILLRCTGINSASTWYLILTSFNMSRLKGTVPLEWKKEHSIPIFKIKFSIIKSENSHLV